MNQFLRLKILKCIFSSTREGISTFFSYSLFECNSSGAIGQIYVVIENGCCQQLNFKMLRYLVICLTLHSKKLEEN